MKKVLIANRGEIAIRIAQAAAEYGVPSVAVYSGDDAESLHVVRATEAVGLHGTGPAAYLDSAQLLVAAEQSDADAVHPGYGFLSENAEFARACEGAGIRFIGPAPEVLESFGNKLRARSLARDHDVPVAAGSFSATTLAEAKQLFAEIDGGVMLKAVAGGGGRGMRAVTTADALDEAWQRCSSEAATAFGNDAVYVEQLLPAARHIEVQIVGDGVDVVALGERDCSLQRRHQKVLEIAPAPGLPQACRERLYQYACKLGTAVGYRGIGTVEFMLWDNWQKIAFIEVNPRLQVEHTITEQTTGLDLVVLQLALADGRTLGELGVSQTPPSRGMAIQARVCMEEMQADSSALASGGILTTFEPPSGPAVRVDHFGYAGYATSPRFDSLLAKVITTTRSEDLALALAASYRALCEFRIGGVATNLEFLQSLVTHAGVLANDFDTGFIAREIASLITTADHPRGFIDSDPAALPHTVLGDAGPEGSTPILAAMQGTVVSIAVAEGDEFAAGQELMVLDSMKLEHVIVAPSGGRVAQVVAVADDTVFAGHPLLHFYQDDSIGGEVSDGPELDLELIRPDLQRIIDLHAYGLDENRRDQLDKLHARGKQSARENIAQLTEGGDFLEYGALAVAAQRRRRELEDLRVRTPADGLVCGVGEVNRDQFGVDAARTAILAYDYSVLAGTQGALNHRKTDRMIEVVEKTPMPLIFLAEGGGGRPGDVDVALTSFSGLACTSFANLAALNGDVPTIGINAGFCFAGNAAFLALHDVIISTRESWLGMGGPAMIEGGGLGVFHPTDIGPSEVQVANGTIDLLVDTEREAIVKAREYLAYFQGDVSEWSSADQRILRHLVPENRNRAFDMRRIIDNLADTGTVLELRPNYAPNCLTVLARIEGKTTAIVANNNQVLSGAIDAASARKTERFLKVCEQFGLPILFLVDCPGLIVGPKYDAEGTARAAGDLFIAASRLSVPTGAIVIRKCYGLGGMAAMGGHSLLPSFALAWPTGECFSMGIEGSVRLGYRRELEAIADLEAREQRFQEMVDATVAASRPEFSAALLELDAVIDPRESRRWITKLLHRRSR